ncbi:MAG: ABC-type sugar transport system, periplasmic component [Clostridia bacterium]|jgi:raffinose/stachyose/melibiose transport system substrate-binding protein|nr:ABC-type sugar transport system, periplasmic component [Clostridia bacterium]
MKKRLLSLMMCLVLAGGVMSGCSPKTTGADAADTVKEAEAPKAADAEQTETAASDEPVTITIFQNMPEYTDAINAYIEEYKKVKPNVTINLEITQSDYPTMLKAKINSGEIPDVFATTAGGEIEAYAEYSYDLSNEPLAAAMTDAVKVNMSYDGKVYGFPIKSNTFGMIYNKELFEKAGITAPPKTLSELEAACEKLVAIGVKPFTTGYKEWWVQKHVFQHFFDAAQPDDVGGLVKEFIAGKAKFADYPTINDNFFKFVDLAVKYGDDKPLETDLSAEIAAFATGKAAMICGQGPWVEADILKINPSAQIGFTGYPVSENPADCVIIAGADQALRINKDSKVLKEVVELYNWLYTSDYGKKWFSEVAQVIPPIKDAPIPNLQIPTAMQEILKTEKAGDLYINYSLDSFHQKFGEIIQSYIAKAYTKEQAIKEIEAVWPQLGVAQ